jgi:hypothetical protein
MPDGHPLGCQLFIFSILVSRENKNTTSSPLDAASLGHTQTTNMPLGHDKYALASEIDASRRLAALERHEPSVKALLHSTASSDPVNTEGNCVVHYIRDREVRKTS